MNRQVRFIGASFLTVAITLIILHNRAVAQTLPGSPPIAQAHTAAATAGPKEEAEPAEVTLIGITTSLGRTQALLRVKWPARVSNREASYILSEGQSIDGLTLDNLGVTNAIVTLKEGQLRRTVGLQLAEFIPSGRIDFTNAKVPQVLEIYRALAGVELVTDSRVRTLPDHITLQAKADAPAQGAKLLEKALLEQAGVVITRIDDKRVSVTYNDALPITQTEKAPTGN
jgi:hypothetical protein